MGVISKVSWQHWHGVQVRKRRWWGSGNTAGKISSSMIDSLAFLLKGPLWTMLEHKKSEHMRPDSDSKSTLFSQ